MRRLTATEESDFNFTMTAFSRLSRFETTTCVTSLNYYVLLRNGGVVRNKVFTTKREVFKEFKRKINYVVNYWLEYSMRKLVNVSGKPSPELTHAVKVAYIKEILDTREFTVHEFRWDSGVGLQIPILELARGYEPKLWKELNAQDD